MFLLTSELLCILQWLPVSVLLCQVTSLTIGLKSKVEFELLSDSCFPQWSTINRTEHHVHLRIFIALLMLLFWLILICRYLGLRVSARELFDLRWPVIYSITKIQWNFWPYKIRWERIWKIKDQLTDSSRRTWRSARSNCTHTRPKFDRQLIFSELQNYCNSLNTVPDWGSAWTMVSSQLHCSPERWPSRKCDGSAPAAIWGLLDTVRNR